MNSKIIISLFIAIFLILAFTVPVSADKVMPTSTKVFFEKDGQPFNESVKFTVKCYGYIVDDTDPNWKNYWRGNYIRREPGTYNQTEVFSYSATADHYGAEIFEPFYLNYRVIDYCTLYGETNGQKFVIENAGESPVPDCSYRNRFVRTPSRYIDACYFETNQSYRCFDEQQNDELCNSYLEKFDPDKVYSQNLGTTMIDGEAMVRTEEYIECREKARSLDYINCSRYFEEVPCEDHCNPDGNPLMRDCNLYFTIPTDDAGNIIESSPETVAEKTTDPKQDNKQDYPDSIFSAILKFLGLKLE